MLFCRLKKYCPASQQVGMPACRDIHEYPKQKLKPDCIREICVWMSRALLCVSCFWISFYVPEPHAKRYTKSLIFRNIASEDGWRAPI